MKNIAIITARGGSKRIPRKNIKEFCGKPILAYSIEAAINSGIFDEVMVSTDDKEIAEISKAYGANVPFFRSEKTSNDFATTRDVLTEVLNEYEKRRMEFDSLCCIYPTAPFVTAEKLKTAYQRFLDSDAVELLTVTKFSFPPQRGFVKSGDLLIAKNPEMMPMRSQDLEPMYHDAGQFYFYKVDTFDSVTWESKIACIELPDTEVQDIDTFEDWEIAEIKYQLMMKKQVSI